MAVQTLSIEFPDGGTSRFLAMPCNEVASRLSFASQALTEAIFPDGGTSRFLAMPCNEVAPRLSFASQALTEARGFQMVRGGPTIL